MTISRAQKYHWTIIVGASLLFSYVFSLSKDKMLIPHSIANGFNLLGYFGYASQAFLFSLPLFLGIFVMLYYLMRLFLKSHALLRTVIGIVFLLFALSPFYAHPVAIANSIVPPIQPVSHENLKYVIFTFDTEEDWDPDSSYYYDSYSYITSGVFNKLADGLSERNARATFYITPNLARAHPEVLRHLESQNNAIGLHLHPHTLLNVDYPYYPAKEDLLAHYSYPQKLALMKKGKEIIESALSHEIVLFRSGMLSCDYEVEKIATELGFKAISNHQAIELIRPFNIWNLGEGGYDIFDKKKFVTLMDYPGYFQTEMRHKSFVVISGHPMLLYNYNPPSVDEGRLNLFLGFVDYLNANPNVIFINQNQLLELVQSPGSF